MSLSFRNRIAIYYLVATAIVMAVVFSVIFFVVRGTVFRNLDNDLSFEANKHTSEIWFSGDSIRFYNKAEWEEHEHKAIQVNPVFIQLVDKGGRVMDKSPNLKQDQLDFVDSDLRKYFNSKLNERSIRQVQVPIEKDGKVKGYILAAMSLESSISVILKLRNVLILSYFFLLIGLYFVSRFLAGRSIIPVKEMTATITRITKSNLNERVVLPQNQDEIYELSTSFNALLERIERALEREKQFTSDASHELRTPLATLRGTLEVLIRKPRTREEYEEKIRYSLGEIEHMASTLEQLLLVARLETESGGKIRSSVPVSLLVREILDRFQSQLDAKGITVEPDLSVPENSSVPQYYSRIIIENILDNAIKYSKPGTEIEISVHARGQHIVLTVQDDGIGIKKEDLSMIYDSFMRSDALGHKHISGNGLGLSIVKKCVDAIGADIEVESELGKGTTVTVTF